jgi:hypothetical protein
MFRNGRCSDNWKGRNQIERTTWAIEREGIKLSGGCGELKGREKLKQMEWKIEGEGIKLRERSYKLGENRSTQVQRNHITSHQICQVVPIEILSILFNITSNRIGFVSITWRGWQVKEIHVVCLICRCSRSFIWLWNLNKSLYFFSLSDRMKYAGEMGIYLRMRVSGATMIHNFENHFM